MLRDKYLFSSADFVLKLLNDDEILETIGQIVENLCPACLSSHGPVAAMIRLVNSSQRFVTSIVSGGI